MLRPLIIPGMFMQVRRQESEATSGSIWASEQLGVLCWPLYF